MRRIGVIADAHGNLPATRAALDALEAACCDEVIHVGDAVGIGPNPSEVVALLMERGVRCLMENHDELAAFGLPEPLPRWISEGEAEHQRWTRSQLSEAQLDILRSWPYELSRQCGQTTVACIHYTRKTNGAFEHIANPAAEELLRLYQAVDGDVVVYGHDHREHDVTVAGRRFLNPGSVGCHDKAEARALLIEPGTTRAEAVQSLAAGHGQERGGRPARTQQAAGLIPGVGGEPPSAADSTPSPPPTRADPPPPIGRQGAGPRRNAAPLLRSPLARPRAPHPADSRSPSLRQRTHHVRKGE